MPSDACGFVPGSAAQHAPSEIAPPSRSAPAWPESLASAGRIKVLWSHFAGLLENTGALALQFTDLGLEHTSASQSHAESKTETNRPVRTLTALLHTSKPKPRR